MIIWLRNVKIRLQDLFIFREDVFSLMFISSLSDYSDSILMRHRSRDTRPVARRASLTSGTEVMQWFRALVVQMWLHRWRSSLGTFSSSVVTFESGRSRSAFGERGSRARLGLKAVKIAVRIEKLPACILALVFVQVCVCVAPQRLSRLHVVVVRAVSWPLWRLRVRIIARFHADLKLIVPLSWTSMCFQRQRTQIPSAHSAVEAGKFQSIISAHLIFTKFTLNVSEHLWSPEEPVWSFLKGVLLFGEIGQLRVMSSPVKAADQSTRPPDGFEV